MNEKIENEKELINSAKKEELQAFSLSVFDRLSNKSAKLLNNKDEVFFQKGKNQTYNIYFKSPIFVTAIHVDVEGYGKSDEFQFHYYNEQKVKYNSKKVKRLEDTEKFSVFPGLLLQSFSFRPPRRLTGSQILKAIRVYGLLPEQFNELCKTITDIEGHKERAISEIDKLVADAKATQVKAKELKDQEADLVKTIIQKKADETKLIASNSELLKTKTEYEASISESGRLESDREAKIISLDDELDKKTKESQMLNTLIEQDSSKLAKLKENINQFPASFSGFLEQGGKNITRYAWFTLVPLILIVGLTVFLFWGAADLSARYDTMEKMDLYTMLASRLPFTLIAGGIIFASYRLAKFLIEEIMKITRQRLTLTRISIIAKQVSQTSMVGLDLTEKEKAEIQIKLKMDILKAHLKMIVDKDYENKIELSIWDKFRSRTKIPNIKAKADTSGGAVEIDNKKS